MPENRLTMWSCFRCGIILLVLITLICSVVFYRCRELTEPIYSIQEFYIPALNRTTNHNYQTTIGLKLEMKNKSWWHGIHYDAINVTIYYGRNSNTWLGSVSVSGFYQGKKKKANRIMKVVANGFSRKTAMEEVNDGKMVFRVDLVTELRYRYFQKKSSKPKWMINRVGGIVTVNEQGMKSETKSVMLNHIENTSPPNATNPTASYPTPHM